MRGSEVREAEKRREDGGARQRLGEKEAGRREE